MRPDDLVTAFALLLMIEGLMPFLSPGLWRKALQRILQLSDGQIRFCGFSLMIAGMLLLLVWKLIS